MNKAANSLVIRRIEESGYDRQHSLVCINIFQLNTVNCVHYLLIYANVT